VGGGVGEGGSGETIGGFGVFAMSDTGAKVGSVSVSGVDSTNGAMVETMVVVNAPGRASLLRRLVGRPAGLVSAVGSAAVRLGKGSRRGSFLVLVVGTLAVLAIITIAYVAIGAQDARLQQAVKKSTAADDVPKQFVDYVGDVIGRDALAKYASSAMPPGLLPGSFGATNRVLLRETTDYPSTSWLARFPTSPLRPRQEIFDPAGTVESLNDAASSTSEERDAIYGGDPWLADISPVFLDYDQDISGGVPIDDATALVDESLDRLIVKTLYDVNDRKEMYRQARDWRHISNLAPDGRFVNLGNLAPKLAGSSSRVPNLRAASGFGTYKAGAVDLFRMSENLTLWEKAPSESAVGVVAINPDINGAAGTLSDFRTLDASKAADKRRIALWDSRQRGAFRPARDADRSPGDLAYSPYQWADASGSGFYDSRWFELVDAAEDPGNPIEYLKTDGQFRYFFAAKVIDLSALVNLNTATDLRAPGNASAPVGLTPADIDLLRVLLAKNLDEQTTAIREREFLFPVAPNTRSGQATNKRLLEMRGQEDYPQPQLANSPTFTRNGWPVLRADMTAANYASEGPGATPDGPTLDVGYEVARGYNVPRAERLGHYGYLSLRLALASNSVPPITNPLFASSADAFSTNLLQTFRGDRLTQNVGPAFTQGSFASYAGVLLSGVGDDTYNARKTQLASLWDFNPIAPAPPKGATLADLGKTPSGAENRRNWYLNQARATQGTAVGTLTGRTPGTAPTSTGTQSQIGRFGIDDLAELLTYFGSNDSDHTSALELVLGGRDAYVNTDPVPKVTTSYSPLRSNRDTSIEMATDRVRNLAETSATLGLPTPDGVADRQAMLKVYGDPRRQLTTISGARPIRSTPGLSDSTVSSLFSPGVSDAGLSEQELKIDATTLLDGSGRALADLYRGYADALLPMSWLTGAWTTPLPNTVFPIASPRGSAQWRQTRTLFYGHNGAETANLIAASMAVNFQALAGTVPPEYRASDENFRDQASMKGRPTPPPAAIVVNNAPSKALLDPFTGGAAQLPVQLMLPEGAPADRGRVANKTIASGLDAPLANAVAVYGVQAQPFLTGVQVITVYTDAPEGAKDPTGGPDDPLTGPTKGDIAPGTSISIRATLAASNADFLFRMVAFQITNPSDVDITLSSSIPWKDAGKNPLRGETSPINDLALLNDWNWGQQAWSLTASTRLPIITHDDDFYYIQVGRHFYKLAEIVERAANVGTVAEESDRDDGRDTSSALASDDSFKLPAFAADNLGLTPSRKGEYLPGGRGSDTARRSLQPVTMRPITIKAGQTIVAYALSQPPRQILNRLLNVNPPAGTATSGRFGEGFEAIAPGDEDFQPVVTNIIKGLLLDRTSSASPSIHLNLNFNEDRTGFDPGPGPTAGLPTLGHAADPDYPRSKAGELRGAKPDQILWIPEFDMSTPGSEGRVILPDDKAISELIEPDTGTATSATLNREVLLWRAIRTPDNDGDTQSVALPLNAWDGSDIGLPPVNLRTPNSVVNDLLADRLRVPSTINLDARMRPPAATPVVRVSGSNGGDEWKAYEVDDGGRETTIEIHNTGLTFAMVAGVMRPYDPIAADSTLKIEPGTLPTYCFESKFPSGDWNASVGAPVAAGVGTDSNPLLPLNIAGATFPFDRVFYPGTSGGLGGLANAKRSVGRETLRRWMIEVANSHLLPRRDVPADTKLIRPVPELTNMGYADTFWPQTPPTTTPGGRDSTPFTQQAFFQTMATAPSVRKKGGSAIQNAIGGADAILSARNVDNMPYRLAMPRFAFNTGGFWGEVLPQVTELTATKQKRFESKLRGADMLLPLAVSHYRMVFDDLNNLAPDLSPPPPPPGPPPVTDNTWTTFGEAMCVALGYGPPPNPGNAKDLVWLLQPRDALAARPGASEIVKRTILDRGQLRLDEFTPFIDEDPAVPTDPIAYEPTKSDQRAWTQIPLALNVLDVFSALPISSMPASNGDPLQRVVPGLLNINTASVQTLRSLPMLSPRVSNTLRSSDNLLLSSDHPPGLPSGDRNKAWWWKPDGSDTFNLLDTSSDIATTIKSYRDKTPEFYRSDSNDRFNFARNKWLSQAALLNGSIDSAISDPIPNIKTPVNFGKAPPLTGALWGSPGASVPPTAPDREVESRGYWADVNGLREQPGFQSPGEIFLSRVRYSPSSYGFASRIPSATVAIPNWFSSLGGSAGGSTGATAYPEDWAMPSNMDFLGYMYHPTRTTRFGPATALEPLPVPDSLGVASYNAATLTGATKAKLPGNSYADQLAILNAVSNSITTRSDYFACWFLVHGYQESDLLNLTQDDPITPSVARRFLVVFDRSNVKSKGDKPRVLLMREVPVVNLN
jgi:hypothetical protein